MIAKPGIYTISAEEYYADPLPAPSLSSSIAKLLCDSSPLHAKSAHVRLNGGVIEEDEDTRMNIGTIAHALLLEGLNKAEVLSFNDWRTNAAKDARTAAREAGRIPLLEKHYGPVLAMVTACRSQLAQHKDASDAFENGWPEQVIVWEEETSFGKIWCRAKPDWIHQGFKYIDDLKTTSATANPEVVSRTLFTNGLDIQAAFYRRGFKAVHGHLPPDVPLFRFVFIETYAPHALSVISLAPNAMTIGEKKVQYAIDRFAECLKRNDWPGYPDRTCYAELPDYLETRWLQRETEEI